MNRLHKDAYCFLSDESNKYYQANQYPDGTYTISKNSTPVPIRYNPANLLNNRLEFGTNEEYFSLQRTITYPLEFIKDGAAILRNFYYNGRGKEEKVYLTIMQWNGTKNIYELSYRGKVDLSEKTEDPKMGKFTAPCVDDSAWGVLSENDKVEYAIDCSERNPKAIKVLFDSITLVNKYTFKTVNAPIIKNGANNEFTVPMVLINESGDSYGLVVKNQTYQNFDGFVNLEPVSGNYFFLSMYALEDVHIYGTFTFSWHTDVLPSGGIILQFRTTKGKEMRIFTNGYTVPPFKLVPGKIYEVEFDFTWDLEPDEKIYLLVELNDNSSRNFSITPIATNIFIDTKTKAEPQTAWGLRPLDALQQIVAKATDNKFTIDSEWFRVNNKDILLSGESIRQVPNAKLYTSFADFFATFNALFFMAMRMPKGELYMEKAVEVYKQNGVIVDLGEAVDVTLVPANEYSANALVIGSRDQDYRHASGRLEFNAEQSFSLPTTTANKKKELITKYRTGCYDIMFLILDYQGGSTTDNSGDKSVYLAAITDEVGSASDNIENFENVNIINSPLEPIIKSPRQNDTLTFNKPVVRGISEPGATVNIYVDSVLDGTTTSDTDGRWNYNINTELETFEPDVSTGLHTIEATFGDLSDPTSSVVVLIDTASSTPTVISYPAALDNLFNNKPLVRGWAEHGQNIDLVLDGVPLASIVTDNSNKWEYKFTTPLTNGDHTLVANGNGSDSVTFNVDAAVATPIITYIGSELDGFEITDNMPLIEGVALPNTTVDLWFDYIKNAKIGSTVSDANGNWSYQVVPVIYIDPISGAPVTIAPFDNGLHVISTSLTVQIVNVGVSGFKLDRPDFTSITGVTDNTVFNTRYTPHRMAKNHYPMFASMFRQQPKDIIRFEKSTKNANLRTILGTEIVSESADIPVSALGEPIALLEWANVRTPTYSSFAKTLYDFNNGGIIKVLFRNTTLYMLPIGTMGMENITGSVQEWKLLCSPLTTYMDLLNLYKNGLTVKLMKNAIYHSDYNSLHFVKYDHQMNAKYNYATIYEDWHENRNEPWLYNPEYVQKWQTTELLRDQIITNGVSNVQLKLYRCKEDCKDNYDAPLIQTYDYEPVSPAPLVAPEVVLEAAIDMSVHPDGQYFTVLSIGGVDVAISERIHSKTKWENTILIEASNSVNMTGMFYSSGIRTSLRIEGLIKKLQPVIATTSATSESGNRELLHSVLTRRRIVRCGTAYGLPDYLYLKVANAISLDELQIETEWYVLEDGDKLEPSDDVEGHPLYYYEVPLTLQYNEKGIVFEGAEGAVIDGVVLVMDAEAFGLPFGSLINIELPNE